jgi:hypothetical protein
LKEENDMEAFEAKMKADDMDESNKMIMGLLKLEST